LDYKSLIAGVFLAFGISNILRILSIPFSVTLGIVLFGIDVGTLILAAVSLAIAYYLVKSN